MQSASKDSIYCTHDVSHIQLMIRYNLTLVCCSQWEPIMIWSLVQYNLLMLTSGLQFHNKIHLCTEYFHRYFLKTVAVRDISWHAVWTTERRPSRKCLQPFSSTKGKLNPNKKYIYLKSLKLTLSPHCINKDRIKIRKIKWKILHSLNNINLKKSNY